MDPVNSNLEALAMNNAITVRNQKESPFLRLPGEIRNTIYSYAFDSCTAIRVSPTSGKLIHPPECKSSHGLTLAYRQLKTETEDLCWSTTSVHFPSAIFLDLFHKTIPATTLQCVRYIYLPDSIVNVIIDCGYAGCADAYKIVGAHLPSLESVRVDEFEFCTTGDDEDDLYYYRIWKAAGGDPVLLFINS